MSQNGTPPEMNMWEPRQSLWFCRARIYHFRMTSIGPKTGPIGQKKMEKNWKAECFKKTVFFTISVRCAHYPATVFFLFSAARSGQAPERSQRQPRRAKGTQRRARERQKNTRGSKKVPKDRRRPPKKLGKCREKQKKRERQNYDGFLNSKVIQK